MGIIHGQTLYGLDGSVVTFDGFEDREELVRRIVSHAISAGFRPPRWWQFWNRWPADCVAEYRRQRAR